MATVPTTGIDFKGLEIKKLETKHMHFYDMEPVNRHLRYLKNQRAPIVKTSVSPANSKLRPAESWRLK